jgi:basic membrane lipoprotein Med (substrate-binding protein (PBP1-ABC) superfamily)
VELVVRRRWVWVAAAAAVVVSAVVVWWVWPSRREVPRARPYLDYTACLLTDGQGIAGVAARPVWAGLEDASLATHARVQYLAVVGESTVANALPYLSSLVQRRCAVVVAVGAAQVAAVNAAAAKYPGVRFVVVGGPADGGNVIGLNGLSDTQVRDRIRVILTDAVHSAGPR